MGNRNPTIPPIMEGEDEDEEGFMERLSLAFPYYESGLGQLIKSKKPSADMADSIGDALHNLMDEVDP